MNTEHDWRKADEYSLDTTMQYRKSAVVYMRFGGLITPIAYIAKPKWVSESDFADFLLALKLEVKVPVDGG